MLQTPAQTGAQHIKRAGQVSLICRLERLLSHAESKAQTCWRICGAPNRVQVARQRCTAVAMRRDQSSSNDLQQSLPMVQVPVGIRMTPSC